MTTEPKDEKDSPPNIAELPAIEDRPSEGGLDERVISVNRCAKVVKGGRNFSFSALVVVGDRRSHVGVGFGKANEVADAIRKAGESAKKNLITVPMNGSTITHEIHSKFRAAKIIMKPASRGTGIIAGGSMRAVLELAGVHDILAKSLGSNNPSNVVKATIQAINALKSKEDIFAKRGITVKPGNKNEAA